MTRDPRRKISESRSINLPCCTIPILLLPYLPPKDKGDVDDERCSLVVGTVIIIASPLVPDADEIESEAAAAVAATVAALFVVLLFELLVVVVVPVPLLLLLEVYS